MLSPLAKIIMLLCSYSPLLFIFAVRFWNAAPLIPASLFAAACLSIAGALGLLKMAQTKHAEAVIPGKIVARDGDATSYIISYLIPFIGISFTDTSTLIAFCILAAVMGIIYCNSNMLHANPILNVIGYHLFEVDSNDGRVITLISKRRYIVPSDQLQCVQVAELVYMEKSK